MGERGLDEIGRDILFAARNELYLSLPYLDAALCMLRFAPENTLSFATDGETLFYDSHWLADRYLRNRTGVNRAYLHVVLHCLLRHLAKKRGHDAALWDLACDVVVESILDALGEEQQRAIRIPAVPARQRFYALCRSKMRVLTAEGIYRVLQAEHYSEYERAQLQRLFLVDDHSPWDREQSREERQDRRWQELTERTQTALETVFAGKAEGAAPVLEQVSVSARDGVDYRAFLRRFAAVREVPEVDGNAFDLIYYTYGLAHYGNLPLLEPPETREARRVERLVIALDTSMSTSGEIVREFLRCTYAILRSTETFARRFDIRILQCDDQVRSETVVQSLDELDDYENAFTLTGGSSTDFRPVFDHIAQQQRAGELVNLRGLIYFTDGMGIYPRRRPPYDAVFVLPEEPPPPFELPPWAIRLILPLFDLERAAEEAGLHPAQHIPA